MSALTINNSASSPLLTRKQVAAIFGVHVETVKRWQKDGRLPAIVINSRVTRYSLEAVERLIQDALT